jgi:hypothetical protein
MVYFAVFRLKPTVALYTIIQFKSTGYHGCHAFLPRQVGAAPEHRSVGVIAAYCNEFVPVTISTHLAYLVTWHYPSSAPGAAPS